MQGGPSVLRNALLAVMKTRRVQRKNKEIPPRHIKCEEQAAENMYDSINTKSSQIISLFCTALPKGKTRAHTKQELKTPWLLLLLSLDSLQVELGSNLCISSSQHSVGT